MEKDNSPCTKHITYVVSQYPAISHTFILNEINGIEESGIQVSAASINKPDRPFEKLTEQEKVAYKKTHFVKTSLKKNLPIALFKSLIQSPIPFFQTFFYCFILGLKYPLKFPHHIAYWLQALNVAKLARDNNSSHIHAHFSTQGCTVAMLAAQLASKTFSFTVHGPDEFYNINENNLQKKFSAADFIICISSFARSQIMKYLDINEWHKIHVNYLGVNTSLFKPIEQKNNLKPKLLCVGRLCNAKGQGVLMEAVRELNFRGVDFELQMVGDGPDRKELEAYSDQYKLRSNVKFLGKINHDQVQVLQREADIFVIPSFAEGIPIVLMEAMASGTPCVTTHITGIPELFKNEHNGLLVPPGNSAMLADSLERLIKQPDLRKQLSRNALETIRENWCIDDSNKRLSSLFNKLLSDADIEPV